MEPCKTDRYNIFLNQTIVYQWKNYLEIMGEITPRPSSVPKDSLYNVSIGKEKRVPQPLISKEIYCVFIQSTERSKESWENWQNTIFWKGRRPSFWSQSLFGRQKFEAISERIIDHFFSLYIGTYKPKITASIAEWYTLYSLLDGCPLVGLYVRRQFEPRPTKSFLMCIAPHMICLKLQVKCGVSETT